MATRVGTFLDRYEIDAEIGRGAMGVVYRARDPKLDRTVAIKTVSISGLEPEAEQEYRKRFGVEARAAGRLSHPGIVTIFDVREEAEPYLVMEYIEGQSLQDLLSRENRTLPLSTTLRLIQELAEALHYAHAQGVVHRDIKPANILVTPDGHPKIADFGVAKLNQADMTLPGQIFGSPAYMAPEQLMDEKVDARSDLFSLGVILYYMLTGHRPFQGNSTRTVCFKLVNHEPVPVSAFESKFPPELDTIVSRAIAKDPEQRYQSGMAMASDIQGLRERSGFVNCNVDWTARSLKRDATTERALSEVVPADSPSTPAENSASGSGGLWFPSTDGLAYALLAVAMAAVTFFSLRHTKPGLSGPNTIEPSVQQSSRRDDNDSGKQDRSTTKPVIRAKALRPPVQVLALPANIPVAVGPAETTLGIEISHHFIDARASVWIDNDLVYAHSLRGDPKRRGLIFWKVDGHQFEAIRVPTGKHNVRVRIRSAADSYDQSKTIADVMLGSSESMLRIVCGKKPSQLQLMLR